jgi:hypothetical protein
MHYPQHPMILFFSRPPNLTQSIHGKSVGTVIALLFAAAALSCKDAGRPSPAVEKPAVSRQRISPSADTALRRYRPGGASDKSVGDNHRQLRQYANRFFIIAIVPSGFFAEAD